MKIIVSKLRIRTALNCLVLLSLPLLSLYASDAPTAHAQGMNRQIPTAASQSRKIILVPGTVAVGGEIQNAIVVALEGARDLFPTITYFAITDLRLDGNWALASVIGLAHVHDGLVWSIDDGAWVGVVLLKQDQNGSWMGGTQGTPLFSSLIDEAPSTFLDGTAKQNLDLLRQPSGQQPSIQSENTYLFPWLPGASMFYGNQGVHDNGFSGIVSGWKAVDMMSDGNTGLLHAPNSLLAAAPGTITYKCTDSNNVAIHLGDFFYTHLVDNPGLLVGSSFAQGAELGQMKVGSFGKTGSGCGWANQPAGWFHVHWGFPNTDLHVENWTLTLSTENWTNGAATVTPGGGWITAIGSSACSAPILSGPSDGFASTSQTITFNWSALSGCIFNGYTFRVKTVPTMDSGGVTIVDTANTLPSRTQTIPSQWNKQDLYWGVQAANAPFGASWTVRALRIDPGNAVPTDYGYCSNEGQRCTFSGTAQIWTTAQTTTSSDR